jgi:hypothetical protein
LPQLLSVGLCCWSTSIGFIPEPRQLPQMWHVGCCRAATAMLLPGLWHGLAAGMPPAVMWVTQYNHGAKYSEHRVSAHAWRYVSHTETPRGRLPRTQRALYSVLELAPQLVMPLNTLQGKFTLPVLVTVDNCQLSHSRFCINIKTAHETLTNANPGANVYKRVPKQHLLTPHTQAHCTPQDSRTGGQVPT